MAHRHLAAAHQWLNATKEEKTRMAEAERNKNGLTFEEWHAATGQIGSSEKLAKAWEDGEDPAEHHISLTTKAAVKYMLPDLSPEERADLVGLVVTRTKLNNVKTQMMQKRDELDELEKQRSELAKELEKYGRGFTEAFRPISWEPGEEY